MAHRQSTVRNLSLTEELERLEQQITLTLQEIDSNFSKAHRIVTSSLLPTVEQYAKHSGDVWEGSKFWKQFFEASANITLSNYEEGVLDEQYNQTGVDETEVDSGLESPEGQQQHAGAGNWNDDSEEFTLNSPTQVTGAQSTPRLPPSNGKNRPKSSNGKEPASPFRSPSPRKYTGSNPLAMSPSSEEPSTPAPQSSFRPTAAAASSPFQPNSAFQPSAQQSNRKQNNDYIMHRNVLDKNYRVQATPHSQRRQAKASKPSTTPQTATRTAKPWDDSPDSSPEISAPKLRSDLFSPAPAPRPISQHQYIPQPRTPGLSVLTPGRPKHNPTTNPGPTTSTGRSLFSPENTARYTSANRTSHVFSTADSDSDDDGALAMSPPKTMQFHVPQSRLLQTPAREASRKIVEDLLLTAGGEETEEIEGQQYAADEPSPSVVRKGFDEDDTF